MFSFFYTFNSKFFSKDWIYEQFCLKNYLVIYHLNAMMVYLYVTNLNLDYEKNISLSVDIVYF